MAGLAAAMENSFSVAKKLSPNDPTPSIGLLVRWSIGMSVHPSVHNAFVMLLHFGLLGATYARVFGLVTNWKQSYFFSLDINLLITYPLLREKVVLVFFFKVNGQLINNHIQFAQIGPDIFN